MAPPRSSTALHATTSTSGHATETVQTRGAKRAVGLTTEPAAGELLHHRVAVGVRPPAVQHATQAPRVHPAHKLSAPRRIGPSVADNAPAGPAEQKGTNVRTCLSGSRLHSSNAGRMSWYLLRSIFMSTWGFLPAVFRPLRTVFPGLGAGFLNLAGKTEGTAKKRGKNEQKWARNGLKRVGAS